MNVFFFCFGLWERKKAQVQNLLTSKRKNYHPIFSARMVFRLVDQASGMEFT